MSKEPVWVDIREVFKIIKEYELWGMDTKYLNIYLDTRFINGTYSCTIKTRNNDEYLTLEELKERRHKL